MVRLYERPANSTDLLGNFVGGAETSLPEVRYWDHASLTVTGGAAVSQWDSISLYCRATGKDSDPSIKGQMWLLQVGSF